MHEVSGIKVSLGFMKNNPKKEQKIEEFNKNKVIRKEIKIIYRYAQDIEDSMLNKIIILMSIIFNTLILSLDKYPVNQNY